MKHYLLSTLALLLTVTSIFAQGKLTEGHDSGDYTFIYKLNDQEAYRIAAKLSTVDDDALLHTLIDSFNHVDHAIYPGKLPFGTYLEVKAVKNKIEYTLRMVNNANLTFINDGKQIRVAARDLKGNLISNAEIKAGKHKRLKYNTESKLYELSSSSGRKVLTLFHEGIRNYFSYDQQKYPSAPKFTFFKKIFTSRTAKKQVVVNRLESPYKGYMVFNKPKYKPHDTLKLKTYLLTKKGKAIKNRKFRLELQRSWNDPGTFITDVAPYRDGGYEFSMALSDSLKLRLDQSYSLVLKEQLKGKWIEVIRNSFSYEDYELKSVDFSVRTDRYVHSPGLPVTLYLKAIDENQLAVPDGRVSMVLTSGFVSKFHDASVFVKDTLWKYELALEPIGETKLVVPDSIFPKADLRTSLQLTFLNSNNEKRTAYSSFNYVLSRQKLERKISKDSVYFSYLLNGKSVPQKAKLYTTYSDSPLQDSTEITLPAGIKINTQVETYRLKMTDGYQEHIALNSLDPALQLNAVQLKDSLVISVSNERRIPFWYTVFSGNKIVHKGYATQLDTVLKNSSAKTAQLLVNYLWGGQPRVQQANSFYAANQLDVKLLAPEIVYPGQTVNMQVKVNNAEGKPVPGTDVTAYAFTTKFRTGVSPNLPYFGKSFFYRKKDADFSATALSGEGKLWLDWEKWARKFHLDTMAYYQFVNPKGLYASTEPIPDTNKAILVPFVVKGGEILPVHVLYIDGIPVWFSQAQQLKRYAFSVNPGKYTIEMRCANYTVVLHDYELKKGKKTILSVAADLNNELASVTATKSVLSGDEASNLSAYMLRVTNNFRGDKAILSTNNTNTLLSPLPKDQEENLYQLQRNTETGSLLVGPFFENMFEFKSGPTSLNFIKEQGYTYTFSPMLIKQKSYTGKFGFDTLLTVMNSPLDDYKQNPLKKEDIDSIWNEYLNLRSRTTPLFPNYHFRRDGAGLQMQLDTNTSRNLPYVKNVLIYRYDDPEFLQIYPGNVNVFQGVYAGDHRVIYLLRDNRYLTVEKVTVKSKGLNFFEWKELNVQPADSMSREIDRRIKTVGIAGAEQPYSIREEILGHSNKRFLDPKNLVNVMSGKIIDSKTKSPLINAAVTIKGSANTVVTDAQGRFRIKVPAGGILLLSYISYKTLEIPIINGDCGTLMLEESGNTLNEVVVRGYNSERKTSMTGSVTMIVADSKQMLQGTVAGLAASPIRGKLSIRGNNSIGSAVGGNSKPLIIVDGLPFSGQINDLKQDLIVSIDVLKDADATAIYGAAAAGGVIIIKTKGGSVQTPANAELLQAQQQQSMRSNFSDYAIWQPKLLTDEEGKAAFQVTFPDDITSWNTEVIAMNGNKQTGQLSTRIKSFKALSANFVAPLFALRGDQIRTIGKLMNYSATEESVQRRFLYNGTEQLNSQVKFKNAHIDTMTIVAGTAEKRQGPDSLTFQYTMKQEQGYFDGEIRKIPLLELGVMETKGYFDALIRDTTVNYQFDPALGKVTLSAEASVFPTLLDEMEKLSNYEYLCNEQMASKLKGLLLEKKLRAYLGQEFKGEKHILELLRKLKNNRRPEGTWGWWQNTNEELWISLHVTEALLQAEKQGYEITLDKQRVYNYLIAKMANEPHFDQIYRLKLLRLLNDKYYTRDWVEAMEKQIAERVEASRLARKIDPRAALYEPSLYEQLQLLQAKQQAGMDVDLSWLLSKKKYTMFGNTYWGDEGRNFWNNSVQNTLVAYQVLKTKGGYLNELDAIARFFLEQRKDGQWRNTYESSLILETILPELIKETKNPKPASITLNQTETITQFPFTKVMEPGKLMLSKKGDAPVYFTAYQQFHNAKPEKVDKDFKVNTTLRQNGVLVDKLKAGTSAILEAEVEVRADADYVMIEIPIPAGCSYENKRTNFWGVETHREYFKHKTSIFCTKLKAGKYRFSIELTPRYGGNYNLNPAKAEMMYFPVFFGREGMKNVLIN